MASKKNPLAAMLNSGRRVEAKEFQRDFTVSSAIQGVGDYAIGITKPVLASQTSMGRLAQSLGATSGLLKEFSDYHIQKDQLELQSEALGGKIATQEVAGQKALIDLENAKLRGAVTNETIKQQNTRLEMLQEEEYILNFQADWLGKTPAEQKNSLTNTTAVVEKASESADKAFGKAAVKVAEKGTEEQQTPFEEKFANITKGAALASDYNEYWRKQSIERISRITAAVLTDASAGAIPNEILDEFIELSGLESGSDELKGFLRATSGFNEKNFPLLKTQAKEKAKAIGNERQVFEAVSVLTDGDELSSIYIASLQVKSVKGELVPFLFGPTGLLASITNLKNPEALDNLSQALHGQIGKLSFEGSPFNESVAFGAASAAIDEAAYKAKKDAFEEESLIDKTGRSAAVDYWFERLTDGEPLKSLEAEVSSWGTKSVEELKKSVEDDPKLVEIITSLSKNKTDGETLAVMREILADVSARTEEQADAFLKKHAQFYTNLGEPKHLTSVVTDIIDGMAASGGNRDDGAPVLGEEMAVLTAWMTEGGTTIFSDFTLDKFDNYSGRQLGGDGVVTQYREAIENLPARVKKKFPDVYTPDAKQFLKDELLNINARFGESIKKYAVDRVRAKNELRAKPGPSNTTEEVEKMFGKDKLVPVPVTEERLRERAERGIFKDPLSPEKRFESDEKLRASMAENSFNDRDSPRFREYSKLVTNLLSDKFIWPWEYTARDEESDYAAAHKNIEILEQVRIRTGVSSQEVLDMAQTAASFPTEKKIPILMKEDSFRFEDISPSFLDKLVSYERVPDGTGVGGGNMDYKTIRESYTEAAGEKLKDITIPKNLFFNRNPPVRDLALGPKPPKQADVTKTAKALKLTEEQLLDIAELYGHSDILSFLKAQYETPFHKNQRK
jgi:hypothetical protein